MPPTACPELAEGRKPWVVWNLTKPQRGERRGRRKLRNRQHEVLTHIRGLAPSLRQSDHMPPQNQPHSRRHRNQQRFRHLPLE
jgi:hypothetical protein